MNRYESILSKLNKKLTKQISTMLAQGKSKQEIISAVHALIRSYNPYKRLSQRFLADADLLSDKVYELSKAKFLYLQSITRPKLSKKALHTILVVNNQFALMQNSINQRVVQAVKTAIEDDLTASELTDLIQKSVSGGRYKADTIATTGLQGYSAANRIDLERASGVKKWKYVGPPPNRLFCSLHYGKEYTYEEIQKMNNGQGLPVLYYGGGWNCPHLWQAVITPDLLKEVIQ